MASTNETQYYKLPQFVADDKPGWLSDINPAMQKIDNALHEIAGSAQPPQLKTINQQSLIGSGNIPLQEVLNSGVNIKTVNGESILGAGDLTVGSDPELKTINGSSIKGQGNINLQVPLVSGTNIKTVNGQSLLGNGNIQLAGSDVSVEVSTPMLAYPNGTLDNANSSARIYSLYNGSGNNKVFICAFLVCHLEMRATLASGINTFNPTVTYSSIIPSGVTFVGAPYSCEVYETSSGQHNSTKMGYVTGTSLRLQFNTDSASTNQQSASINFSGLIAVA